MTKWLLVFVPLAIALEHLAPEQPLWVFLTSALAIVPLAGWMGHATEELAARTGEGIGGLLNATFGNAAELIIAIAALRAGLHEVVKASIAGSIIGNILLVLGAAMLAGGLRNRPEQRFNAPGARSQATMLTLATIALILPAAFQRALGVGAPPAGVAQRLDLGRAAGGLRREPGLLARDPSRALRGLARRGGGARGAVERRPRARRARRRHGRRSRG